MSCVLFFTELENVKISSGTKRSDAMKRFDPELTGPTGELAMIEWLDGEYVLFKDLPKWRTTEPTPEDPVMLFQVAVGTAEGGTELETFVGYCAEVGDMLTTDHEYIGWESRSVIRWVPLDSVLECIANGGNDDEQ